MAGGQNYDAEHVVSSMLTPLGGRSVTHGTQISWADGTPRPDPKAPPKSPVGSRIVDILEIVEDRCAFLANCGLDDYAAIAAMVVEAQVALEEVEGSDLY